MECFRPSASRRGYWLVETAGLNTRPVYNYPNSMAPDNELALEAAFDRYLDYYRRPRNYQILPHAQAVGRVEWAGGAMLMFYLQLAPDQRAAAYRMCALSKVNAAASPWPTPAC